MFSGADAFNQDLSKWDVSAVTDMSYFFSHASDFNQDLSKWDVSAVTEMGLMFLRASAFNQDLSKWDVSAVTDMRSMFHRASAFNRRLCGDAWVQSKVDKSRIFIGSHGSMPSTKCKKAKHGNVRIMVKLRIRIIRPYLCMYADKLHTVQLLFGGCVCLGLGCGLRI